MTDNPELVATANLTPESPKPINLSSPVAVPALQDQADNLSTMALSPTEDLPLHPLANMAENPSEVIPDEAQPGDKFDVVPSGTAPTNGATESHKAEKQNTEPEADDRDDDDDDYAKDFDSPVSAVEVVSQAGAASTDNNISTHATLTIVSSPKPSDPPTADDATSEPQAIPGSTSLPRPATETSLPIAAAEVSQSVLQHALPAESNSFTGPSEEEGIDIQALVDNITARHNASKSVEIASTSNEATDGTSGNAPQSSLPPKPPASQQPPLAANLRHEELHRYQPSVPATPASATPTAAYPYSFAAPGVTVPGYAPPYPNPGAAVSVPGQYGAALVPGANSQAPNLPQRYDDFLKEERKYVSEAKWDRFPEGSRLFIGNLSSERVTKREVFDIFSPYGRLAQISLKQAYGFVQYHTVAEGQAATDALQGIEISGRKIHLEFSRAQKKDGDNDRRGNRGERGERSGRGGQTQNDRDRNRFDGRRNDAYRPRSPSPGRAHSRQGSYGRGDRGHWEPPSEYGRRGRSRSPAGFASGNYRRRSPSPYRRGPPASEADLDIPRRYGADVPDVQLLLLQEVNRDFVSWVQGAFVERGLRVDVMFLNPRFPRELVIQRQVVEGVHGVAELDLRSQSLAKIPLQTFDRSAGRHNARFDQYQDLDPKIAAEVVARAKSQSQLQSPAGYATGQYPPANYPPQPQMPPQPYSSMPSQPPANLNLGGLDNATLQRVLSAVQGGQQHGVPGQPSMGIAPGVDVNSVLSVLGANGAAVPQAPQQPVAYPPGPTPTNPADQAHVQNIMAQLSRYRQ